MDQRLLYQHVPADNVPVHASLDVTAYSMLGASVMGWLPGTVALVASTLSAVYFLIQIALGIRTWVRGRKPDNKE